MFRALDKKIAKDGEIHTFLDIFENEMVNHLPDKLLTLVLIEFSSRYFGGDIERCEADKILEPTLKQYMDKYGVEQ
jgi:hypothetical protein